MLSTVTRSSGSSAPGFASSSPAPICSTANGSAATAAAWTPEDSCVLRTRCSVSPGPRRSPNAPVAKGHDPVPASPATGVDTITGEGLADVMIGADVVVDVANAPVWDDDAVREFFTTSTRNLLAAERDTGVGHHVAVSIVGADRLPDSGYLRAKVAQEAEIEAGSIPYTILRSTQFFEFLAQTVEGGAEGDVVRLLTGLIQFVAADDVAATVAELAIGSPAIGRIELGGPEALGIDA